MAIARMLNVTVIGHDAVLDETVTRLQHAGVVQIEMLDAEELGARAMSPDDGRVHVLDELVAGAQFVRDFLGRFRTADVAFGTFISEKIHLRDDEYHALEPDERFAALERECTHISDRLGASERERTRLGHLVHDLEPWVALRLQISQWRGSEHVALLTGVVPLSDSAIIRQALRDRIVEVSVAEVGATSDREAWVAMAYRAQLAEVKTLLALMDFAEVDFPGLEGYPAEERDIALERITELEAEREALELRATELAADYEHVTALVQALLSRRDALLVRESFCETDRTFVLSGWVPERRRAELNEALVPLGSDVDLSYRDPVPGDPVPVELFNPRWIRPFEVLTDLYGRPKYFAFDPTPVMAPFFFLFFGMCIGDVGYGLMLLAGAWAIKNRLDVAPGVKRFMDLLMFGGAASVIWGALTRSYLALSMERLPSFMKYEPLIDPGSELILLLGICVVIGVVHVSTGVTLAFVQRWRAGERVAAVAGPGSSLLFVASLVGLAFSVSGVIDPSLTVPIIAAGALQLMLLQGGLLDVLTRVVPAWHIALVLPKGFLALYGMIGYGSDFLSYTRLAALGLASLYVGDAMNRLTELAAGIPYVGIVFAVLIFVVGHVFNVVINLLGAFVHPTRLQFVEFFGKFYEGGGRNFAPFALRTRLLVLHTHAAVEQKGGTGS
jgi:V/A-type H+-transporting ATPase subunit I